MQDSSSKNIPDASAPQPQSFAERQAIEKSRQMIGSYNYSEVAQHSTVRQSYNDKRRALERRQAVQPPERAAITPPPTERSSGTNQSQRHSFTEPPARNAHPYQ